MSPDGSLVCAALPLNIVSDSYTEVPVNIATAKVLWQVLGVPHCHLATAEMSVCHGHHVGFLSGNSTSCRMSTSKNTAPITTCALATLDPSCNVSCWLFKAPVCSIFQATIVPRRVFVCLGAPLSRQCAFPGRCKPCPQLAVPSLRTRFCTGVCSTWSCVPGYHQRFSHLRHAASIPRLDIARAGCHSERLVPSLRRLLVGNTQRTEI